MCKNNKVFSLVKFSDSVFVDENVLGQASGGLIDPLEELAAVGGTLEIESIGVIDRVGGSQYQG